MTLRRDRLLSIVLVLLAVAASAWASTARIRLSMTDEQGKALEGVKAVLVHDEFKTKFELVTDKKGRLGRIGLPVGRYAVEISKSGFMKLDGTIFCGIAQNRIEQGFPQEAVSEQLSWKNSQYYTITMLQGAASPSGVSLDGVEMTDGMGRIYNKALNAFKAGDYETARVEFETVRSDEPELSYTYFFLFDIYNKLNEPDKAFEALKTGLELKPEKTDAQLIFAQLCQERGDTASAMKAYAAVLEEKPDAATALRDLGLLELKQTQWAQAKEHLSRYVELAPDAKDVEWIKTCLIEIDKYMDK